jgi:hypothetical protein
VWWLGFRYGILSYKLQQPLETSLTKSPRNKYKQMRSQERKGQRVGPHLCVHLYGKWALNDFRTKLSNSGCIIFCLKIILASPSSSGKEYIQILIIACCFYGRSRIYQLLCVWMHTTFSP